jgi:hypothetical protein
MEGEWRGRRGRRGRRGWDGNPRAREVSQRLEDHKRQPNYDHHSSDHNHNHHDGLRTTIRTPPHHLAAHHQHSAHPHCNAPLHQAHPLAAAAVSSPSEAPSRRAPPRLGLDHSRPPLRTIAVPADDRAVTTVSANVVRLNAAPTCWWWYLSAPGCSASITPRRAPEPPRAYDSAPYFGPRRLSRSLPPRP